MPGHIMQHQQNGTNVLTSSRTTCIRIALEALAARAHRPMRHRRAQRIEAARSHARIGALVVQARPVRCAVLMDAALRPARRRCSVHAAIARAHGHRVHFATLRVRAARTRPARVGRLHGRHGRLFGQHDARAADQRVARVLRRTVAHRRMVDRLAQRIVAARARLTRILALLLHANLIAGTVRVVHALGRTADQRIAEEALQTHARQHFALLTALGVRSALDVGTRRRRGRGRRASIVQLHGAPRKRIAAQSGRTAALGPMVLHRADGILAARARARVATALPQAGLVELAVGVGDALGPAQRIVEGTRSEARITDGHVAVHVTCVAVSGGARRRHARIGGVADGCRNRLTLDVRVAIVAAGAGARGGVIVYLAFGVDAAHGGRARRLAATVLAGLLRRTVRVRGALRSTRCLRVALERWQARADRPVARHRALGVEAARAGLARSALLRRQLVGGETPHQRIAGQSLVARAHRPMVVDATVGSGSARSRTRVAAPEAQACLVTAALVVRATLVAVAAGRTGRIAAHAVGTTAQTVAVGRHNTLGARRTRIRLADTARRHSAAQVGVANVAVRTAAMLASAGDDAFGVQAARSGRAQRGVHDGRPALAERIADQRLLALADGLAVRIAHRSDAARTRLARVLRLHAAADRVRRLNVAAEAGALGEAVGENRALRVRAAWRRIARILRRCAQLLRWIALELGQTEARRSPVVAAAAAVRAARIRFAAVALGDALLERVAGGAARAQADRIAAVQFAHSAEAARVRIAGVLRRLTAELRVTGVAGRTATGGTVLEHLAQGVRSTLARRLAVTVDAGLVAGAVTVSTAAQDWQTFDVGVANVSGRTATGDAVIGGHAFGVLAARVLVAGADAASVEPVAQQMWRTVDVVVADVGRVVEDWARNRELGLALMCVHFHTTLTWLTADVTVSLVARRTLAVGAVVDIDALGIQRARIVDGARRSAHVPDARLVDGALVVRFAFDWVC